MKIAIACDHAAFEAKDAIKQHLEDSGHEVINCGTDGAESVDYPDFAEKACRLVQQGEAELGVLICGSGIGMSMAANKMRGIRAALVSEPLSAALTRQHNNANVLCLGVRMVGPAMLIACVEAFVAAAFDGGRHERRVNKIEELHGG